MSPTLAPEFFDAVDHCQAAIWMADLSLRESQAVIDAGVPGEVRAAMRWWTRPLDTPHRGVFGGLRWRELIPGHEWYREAFDVDPQAVALADLHGVVRPITAPIMWHMGVTPRHILDRLEDGYGITPDPGPWRPAVPVAHPAPPRSVHERMGPA